MATTEYPDFAARRMAAIAVGIGVLNSVSLILVWIVR